MISSDLFGSATIGAQELAFTVDFSRSSTIRDSSAPSSFSERDWARVQSPTNCSSAARSAVRTMASDGALMSRQAFWTNESDGRLKAIQRLYQYHHCQPRTCEIKDAKQDVSWLIKLFREQETHKVTVLLAYRENSRLRMLQKLGFHTSMHERRSQLERDLVTLTEQSISERWALGRRHLQFILRWRNIHVRRHLQFRLRWRNIHVRRHLQFRLRWRNVHYCWRRTEDASTRVSRKLAHVGQHCMYLFDQHGISREFVLEALLMVVGCCFGQLHVQQRQRQEIAVYSGVAVHLSHDVGDLRMSMRIGLVTHKSHDGFDNTTMSKDAARQLRHQKTPVPCIGDVLQRYGRQILVKECKVQAQLKVRAARVLLVGLGGLRSPVAMYLVAMGVGTLALVDSDSVERSNLHRQILHDEQGVKKKKKGIHPRDDCKR
ncbi:hypothetical protein PsorP6_009990 [Peronosclerospora sorghi]|uniref:Uncharacterized protein n=1 Tax=Peronosclerospora sorghi TaxID=230839 RepID=A0ACC0VUA6_9STRA|nr:hypothetical protein PsorP6_009990 [Peronosclerospora sorghi]